MGDLTAGAAPVGLRASFRTIRVDMLCRVFALRMLAHFRGLLRIPVGHPLIVLTCFGHRVRAVTAYIGHFYFCTVLDAVLVSAKLILAVLDSISTLLTGRSAIANGSARAIGTAASVLLGTAGGLDLRFAANGHMALAICAAADACAAAVPVTLLHSRHLGVAGNRNIRIAACTAANGCCVVAALNIYHSVFRNFDFSVAAHISSAYTTANGSVFNSHIGVSGDGNVRFTTGFFCSPRRQPISADAILFHIDHSVSPDHNAGSCAASIAAADLGIRVDGAVALDHNVLRAIADVSSRGFASMSTDGSALVILTQGIFIDLYIEGIALAVCGNGERAGADIIVFLDAGALARARQGVIARKLEFYITTLHINGRLSTSRGICRSRQIDMRIAQRHLDFFGGIVDDLDNTGAQSRIIAVVIAIFAHAVLISLSLAGPIGGVIRGVVRGAGGSLGRGIGLCFGLGLFLCFGLLPLASGSIQLPVCRGILLLLFLVSRVVVFILIFGLGLLLRVSRIFGILLLLLFLSSGGVLCLLGLLRGLLLGRSLGRGHRLVFILLVLLRSRHSSISGAIGTLDLDFLIDAVRRRCSVVLLHGDAFIIRRDHKAAVGKIKGGRKCRGGKGYRHAQGHGRRRDLPEQFFSSHDFYLPFCILWLFCQIYYTPPLLSVQYNS